jgi:hypothetical protein
MQYKELLEKWYNRAVKVQNAHYAAASAFNNRHYFLGVPAATMSTIVGSSVFASLGKTSNQEIIILVGIASLLVAILTALQTFTRYGDRSEKHHEAGIRYGEFKREIEQKLVFMPQVPDELNAYITDLRTRWDAAAEECPVIPQRIWNRVDKETIDVPYLSLEAS